MSCARTLKMVTVLIAAIVQLVGSSTWADTPVDVNTDIAVEAATATAARRGEASRVRFCIVNDSTSSVHITGIDTTVAANASLIAGAGYGKNLVLDSIGAPAGEMLDLTTSHIWFETSPVFRDLVPGEVIEVRLNFVGGALTVPVHVHATTARTEPPSPTQTQPSATKCGQRPAFGRY